jgi:hypothetical protein
MVFYDFIEIGTSDFSTEIEKEDDKCGISIEAVRYYFDRLKNKKNCIKLNIGISNYTGKCLIYYVSEKNIRKYNFPDWVRGCNSINSYHKTVFQLCKNMNINIEEISEKEEIEVETLYQIIIKMQVDYVYYLKIDTEGHDTIILKKFYEEVIDNKHLPHIIMFESNVLSNKEDIEEIINLFSKKGYDLYSRDDIDTIMKLNLTKLKNKKIFSEGIKNYYIMDYPLNYDVTKLPHENTLEAAQDYCIKHNYSGVTLQNGVYEVRNGKYMNYYKDHLNCLVSWVFI